MYRKYRIVQSIASSVSQYESYRDQVYRYTPSQDKIYGKCIWEVKIERGEQNMHTHIHIFIYELM